jgi:transketolase
MMEGVSGEAASLAGHLKLSNLCWIYDSNRITIEGSTSLAFSDDVAKRFSSYGWNVTHVEDANDLDMLDQAFTEFRNTTGRPTLIIVESHIAYGSPNKQDTSSAHGEPLGEEEIRLTKRNYGWPEDSEFLVPDEVIEHFRSGTGARRHELYNAWTAKFMEYSLKHPVLADRLNLMQQRELPAGWDSDLPVFPADEKGVASRVSSGKVLNEIAKKVPWLIGGSADLAPSTKTELTFDNAGVFSSGSSGRNFHFGVREHAMASILNGMSVSKIRPYGATFLVFSDYSRPAIRLGSMMEIPAIHIFTHDSIGVGEDGPTHQPIEHLASLRAIPGLITLRPADANEVVEAWRVIMQLRNESAALILTRQALPTLDRSQYAPASGLARGAYILAGSDKSDPDIILLATGSEVPVCIDAFEQLHSDGIHARVVSMPSWELFEKQSREYRDHVLPPSVTARLAVEQASTMGWAEYIGAHGRIIGMRSFGASAPIKALKSHFGFTSENIVNTARELL